ncbi:hypothetical protein [Halopseudomonas maritima]|uniref:hypothetical protein n=1 Tax=Halopseudomonas maritima TaxID=2918528 RepID=UPI001EEA245F|nr:hypothetical protein [Halopseudomonas maritima]UJJ30918.1 hypothetical protein HV822_14275 [Halopseudomonas maritima]
MIALGHVLLTLLLIAVGVWLWRQRAPLDVPARGAITAALLGLGLAASASLLLSLGALPGTSKLAHTQRILGLAAQNLSLPLLGLAALYLGFGLRWQPATWGRILLGLMAAFELSRRMDALHGYQWLINCAALGVMLLACLRVLGNDRRPLPLALVCAAGTLAPLLLPGATPLADLFAVNGTLLSLYPALLGAALAVGLLGEQAHNRPTSDAAASSEDPKPRL